ncbi:TetR/AcrR family transcriptional regulator [Salmonella enterica]|nr:TetR/AcrR family transcriptional regulator [Salmonella enterica subsp. enterica]EKR7370975.1 TetR/AcrR family transcriptional regulator [Salmonella enterica]
MVTRSPYSLNPRKMPRQARAAVTVDIIFEATLQLLIEDGLQRLTTTRVAERAGVSVGTLYQYFPHKESLVYALNERYLQALAEKIEATCQRHQGSRVGEMVEALIDTYWRAKTERVEVTRALYLSVAELDNKPLIDAFARRVDTSTSTMLASATDVSFADLHAVNLTLLTVIFGAVRSMFERNLPLSTTLELKQQLVIMCSTYLTGKHVAVVQQSGTAVSVQPKGTLS